MCGLGTRGQFMGVDISLCMCISVLTQVMKLPGKRRFSSPSYSSQVPFCFKIFC